VNPARLAELNHQRALVREQLAWLDREIAAENAVLPPVASPSLAAPVAALGSADLQAAEAYQPDPVSAANDTRRGCLIAIAVFVLLIVTAFAAIYFLRYSDRPLFFVSSEEDSSAQSSPAAAPPSK
jgi:hypothetical protein